jgi:hypothetical protein
MNDGTVEIDLGRNHQMFPDESAQALNVRIHELEEELAASRKAHAQDRARIGDLERQLDAIVEAFELDCIDVHEVILGARDYIHARNMMGADTGFLETAIEKAVDEFMVMKEERKALVVLFGGDDILGEATRLKTRLLDLLKRP